MHDWCRQLRWESGTKWRRQQIRMLDYAECWHFGVELDRLGVVPGVESPVSYHIPTSCLWNARTWPSPVNIRLVHMRNRFLASLYSCSPDALAYRKLLWISLVHCPPHSSLPLSFPASSTSMITVVSSARRQWLPLAELSQPAQQSRICCFSLLRRWRSCALHHRREGGGTWIFCNLVLYRELVRPK